jgi:hypothetical protein
VKLDTNAYFLVSGNVSCSTGGSPTVFTSSDDNDYGQPITNSTAMPGYAAAEGIWMYYQTLQTTLQNVRVRWAQSAIRYDQSASNLQPQLNTASLEHSTTGIFLNIGGDTLSLTAVYECNVTTPVYNFKGQSHISGNVTLNCGDTPFALTNTDLQHESTVTINPNDPTKVAVFAAEMGRGTTAAGRPLKDIWIASFVLLWSTFIATAQIPGYVTFQNPITPSYLDAPVFDASGNRIIGPGPFLADLFWSVNTNALMDSLFPAGRNKDFSTLTNYGGGYFFGGAFALPATYILAQVRVWDSSYGSTYYEARDHGGQFGFSNLIVVVPSPPPGDPSYLVGLQGFQLQQLPHLGISLTASNTLLFFWRTNLTNYALQQSTGFQPSNWITVTNAAIVIGSENQISLPKPEGTVFYRLISQ